MKRNRLHTILILLGAALIGGLIGTLIKTNLAKAASPATQPADAPESSIQHEPPRGNQNAGRLKPGSDSRLLASLPATQRFLWLATQAEKAELSQFPRLFELTKNDHELRRAIAARWADRDPSDMFEELLLSGKNSQHDISRILFSRWSQSAPRETLAAVIAAKDKKGWTWSLSDELMIHAPEVGVEAYAKLGVKGYLPNVKNVAKWAADDPAAAARHVVKHMGEDNADKRVMEQVGTAWGAADPIAALDYALTIENRLGQKLAEAALATWADQDPEAALDFASKVEDPFQRANLGKGLVAGLAKKDPQKALEWAQENLESQARATAIKKLVERVAKEEIGKAAKIVAALEPGSAMNEAAKKLVNEWTRDGLDAKEDVLKWIDSLPDKEAQNAAMWDLGWRMDMEEKDGLIDFVAGEYGHLASPQMIRSASATRVGQDPKSAVDWAKALPKDRSEKVLAAVIAQWRNVQPEEVKRWEAANR